VNGTSSKYNACRCYKTPFYLVVFVIIEVEAELPCTPRSNHVRGKSIPATTTATYKRSRKITTTMQ